MRGGVRFPARSPPGSFGFGDEPRVRLLLRLSFAFFFPFSLLFFLLPFSCFFPVFLPFSWFYTFFPVLPRSVSTFPPIFRVFTDFSDSPRFFSNFPSTSRPRRPGKHTSRCAFPDPKRVLPISRFSTREFPGFPFVSRLSIPFSNLPDRFLKFPISFPHRSPTFPAPLPSSRLFRRFPGFPGGFPTFAVFFRLSRQFPGPAARFLDFERENFPDICSFPGFLVHFPAFQIHFPTSLTVFSTLSRYFPPFPSVFHKVSRLSTDFSGSSSDFFDFSALFRLPRPFLSSRSVFPAFPPVFPDPQNIFPI